MSLGKILAIDDEQNIRTLIANELTLEGFGVTTAKSGEEGLRLCDKEKFDVVLLDIRLPKMNGIEVLRRLKEKTPDVRVIMITAYGDIKTAVESMKLGAQDYVTKPFKLSELLALIRQVMGDGRKSFYLTHFHKDVGDPQLFHVVMNIDRLDADEIAEMIGCSVMKRFPQMFENQIEIFHR